MAPDGVSTADSVIEVSFAVEDERYPFVGVSAAEECRVELARMLPRSGDTYAEYFSVSGSDPDRVMARASEAESVEARLMDRRPDGGLFEFLVDGSCPARYLAERGALPRAVESDAGEGRIVCDVLPETDASELVATFVEAHPGAAFVAKREKEHATPLFTERELQYALDERLTDRQREVLRAAFEGGYYEVPRRRQGSAIAADLDISQPTFSQHLRAAERKLIALLYDEWTRTG